MVFWLYAVCTGQLTKGVISCNKLIESGREQINKPIGNYIYPKYQTFFGYISRKDHIGEIQTQELFASIVMPHLYFLLFIWIYLDVRANFFSHFQQ